MLGRILGGRYQVTHHLGGGGFGQTYLAEDLHLPGKPQCVVKQLKPRVTNLEALQTARRLFDTEAEVLYALGSHDQIPRLFAHFEENRDFFLVQEFVEGEVFSQEIKNRKQFPETEVIDLVQDILTVLEFVHQQQVVHRDIKPSNLIRRRGDRRMILIDFGAVKQIGIEAYESPDQASVTIAVGSSGYMPNEQLAGKPRFSSDVYAVGMMAIQCLIGVNPKQLKEDPKTSEIIWRDQAKVSPEFAAILDKMVRYDFRQRYPSAKEALDDLRSLTTTTSVSALLSERTLVSCDGHLAWLERGDDLFQLQRYKEAVSAYDRVIQAKPEEYLAWFKRGIALENLQRYEDAAESYEQVVRLHPEDYLAWYKWGGALECLHRYQEALQSYERVVELRPDNYWAWHDRGKVLEALRQYDEAIASYDRAVQLKPDFQLAVENRKRVLSQLSRVDALYHLQHYDEAVASCDRAIQENPNDPIPWLMRGMALEKLECHEEAIAAYDRVVEIQPDDHVAWFKRANLLEKLNRHEEAIASYDRVVQIQPENYWAWHDRGRLLEHLQRYEEAIASYDRAVQIKPDFQAAIEGRRRMLNQMQSKVMPLPVEEEDETIVSVGISEQPTSEFEGQELEVLIADYKCRLVGQGNGANGLESQEETTISYQQEVEETAIRVLREEEATTVSLPQADLGEPISVEIGDCSNLPPPPQPCPTALSQRKDGEEGPIREEWQAIKSTEPALENYHQRLQKGLALEKEQRYLEALAAYDQASHIYADDAHLWQRRGHVLYALGRYETAIASYRRALELEPENADVWCRLGGTFVRLKQLPDAVTCFNRAVELKPTSHTSWYWQGRLQYELKRYAAAIQSFDRALELKPDFQPAIQERLRTQRQLNALEVQDVGV
ncbi:tetratricopeptide repeat protein [Leptothermofonsia sp. ETS-13]|uniref:tetratricopeptide repeat protein n=1 Tax=Leptothermofonsia sp. ETS-13 TaxID=3035696 RepID=UPI003B9F6438